MGPAVCSVHLSLVDRIDHTRAPYHHKLLVPHIHLGHISSPMESPVFGHHISLDNRKDSLPEGEGKDLGNSDKLYLQCWQLQDILPRSCAMIFATGEDLGKMSGIFSTPFEDKEGAFRFDVATLHLLSWHNIYCPFKVLANKISV